MTVFRIILPVVLPIALLGLAGCVPTTQASYTSAPPEIGVRGGIGPPSGRTGAEREARKDYYRGPRGDEF
ncbi:MAG: hypothetical protein ACI8R4_004046 [Paracoccaceae bacterium]|jgi:hypothetical protein